MQKKHYILIAISIIVLITLVFTFNKQDKQEDIIAEAKFGKIEIVVNTSGELQAENSEDIQAPSSMRQANIWRVKITDLIDEGTVVDSGDYVATLDRSELENALKDVMTEISKMTSVLKETTLDTAIELRNAREHLINLEYALEERKIEVEQSKFEPPAIQRQAKISLEKAQREYNQNKENYTLKVQQAEAKVSKVNASLEKEIRKKDQYESILQEFVIYAPKPGMITYAKEWNGKKRGVGDMISPWDLTVATLPDLTKMISKTYVNEIDISKVKNGQTVDITVDAFPSKKFKGEVFEVANVGQDLAAGNSKVFEVIIKLFSVDSIMKPGMTTTNNILVESIDSVLFIPLECLHISDSLSFVYLYDKKIKQEVKTGKSNNNEIIIKQGLKQGQRICLTIPENEDAYKTNPLKTNN